MVKSFKSLANLPTSNLGGKAQSLIILSSQGFSVPSGFVITPQMQKQFFIRNGIIDLINKELIHIKSSNFGELSNSAKKIRKAIINGQFSQEEIDKISNMLDQLELDKKYGALFAVRSSAIVEDGNDASWAGQFDSFLDVNKEDITQYIKHCWASMFSVRAMKYGMSSLLENEVVPFSVIVQQMITGEYSGIAFSVNPTDQNANHIRIEAVPGTGEKAVSGRINPYTIVMDKKENVIIKRTFGSSGRIELVKPSVLKRLSECVKKIESLYNTPVDVEWTAKDDKIFILQARPITATIVKLKNQKYYLPDILDYELTFKVSGLGFMFADLLCRGFGYLHPLFICSKGEFLQYFTNERMEYAARFGHRWLSSEKGFIEYRNDFTKFHNKTYKLLNEFVNGECQINNIKKFFEYVYQYFIYYSKMDFQFTNLTFLYAGENPTISENLKSLSEFKDVARVWVNSVSINNDCLLNQLLGILSNKFDIDISDLEYYSIEEIFDLFENKRVDKETLDSRYESSIAYSDGKTINYSWGTDSIQYVEQVKKIYKIQETADIIGQVANKNKERCVTGKVALINVDYSDLDSMEQSINDMETGSILVSEFTAPELIGACNKAKAIVTDLGGMLSHAAIVSRELKIPCVVGTEHASKSLKNGDIIKIDFELGIVEVLER